MARTVLSLECSVDPWAKYMLDHAWPKWLAYVILMVVPARWYLSTKVIEE